MIRAQKQFRLKLLKWNIMNAIINKIWMLTISHSKKNNLLFTPCRRISPSGQAVLLLFISILYFLILLPPTTNFILAFLWKQEEIVVQWKRVQFPFRSAFSYLPKAITIFCNLLCPYWIILKYLEVQNSYHFVHYILIPIHFNYLNTSRSEA